MVNPKPCHRAQDAVRSAHQPLREGEKSGAISMGWLWGAEQRLGYLLTPVVVCSSASWFLVKTKSSLTCSWVDLSLLQGRAISSGAEVYTMLWGWGRNRDARKPTWCMLKQCCIYRPLQPELQISGAAGLRDVPYDALACGGVMARNKSCKLSAELWRISWELRQGRICEIHLSSHGSGAVICPMLSSRLRDFTLSSRFPLFNLFPLRFATLRVRAML